MALTITYDHPRAEGRRGGDLVLLSGNISFDSSYPTGGESFDLTGKFKSLKFVLFENEPPYQFKYDYTNKKVKVYNPVSFRVLNSEVAGDKTAFVGVADGGGNDPPTGGAAIDIAAAGGGSDFNVLGGAAEVANTTDLSALANIRFLAGGVI